MQLNQHKLLKDNTNGFSLVQSETEIFIFKCITKIDFLLWENIYIFNSSIVTFSQNMGLGSYPPTERASPCRRK